MHSVSLTSSKLNNKPNIHLLCDLHQEDYRIVSVEIEGKYSPCLQSLEKLFTQNLFHMKFLPTSILHYSRHITVSFMPLIWLLNYHNLQCFNFSFISFSALHILNFYLDHQIIAILNISFVFTVLSTEKSNYWNNLDYDVHV